jgi:hypothetical protein
MADHRVSPAATADHHAAPVATADHRAAPVATAATKRPFYPVYLAAAGYFLTGLTTREDIKGRAYDVNIVPDDVTITHKSFGRVKVPVRSPIRGVALAYLTYRFVVNVLQE